MHLGQMGNIIYRMSFKFVLPKTVIMWVWVLCPVLSVLSTLDDLPLIYQIVLFNSCRETGNILYIKRCVFQKYFRIIHVLKLVHVCFELLPEKNCFYKDIQTVKCIWYSFKTTLATYMYISVDTYSHGRGFGLLSSEASIFMQGVGLVGMGFTPKFFL